MRRTSPERSDWLNQIAIASADPEVPVGVDRERRVVGHPRHAAVFPGRREQRGVVGPLDRRIAGEVPLLIELLLGHEALGDQSPVVLEGLPEQCGGRVRLRPQRALDVLLDLEFWCAEEGALVALLGVEARLEGGTAPRPALRRHTPPEGNE